MSCAKFFNKLAQLEVFLCGDNLLELLRLKNNSATDASCVVALLTRNHNQLLLLVCPLLELCCRQSKRVGCLRHRLIVGAFATLRTFWLVLIYLDAQELAPVLSAYARRRNNELATMPALSW